MIHKDVARGFDDFISGGMGVELAIFDKFCPIFRMVFYLKREEI